MKLECIECKCSKPLWWPECVLTISPPVLLLFDKNGEPYCVGIPLRWSAAQYVLYVRTTYPQMWGVGKERYSRSIGMKVHDSRDLTQLRFQARHPIRESSIGNPGGQYPHGVISKPTRILGFFPRPEARYHCIKYHIIHRLGEGSCDKPYNRSVAPLPSHAPLLEAMLEEQGEKIP